MSERRHRVGMLLPPMNIAMEPDLAHWAPAGVTAHAQRLYRSQAVTDVSGLFEMLDGLDEDVRRLAFTRPDVIIYGCTSGSSLEPKQDQEIIGRIEEIAGVPALATAGAVVEALRVLGVRDVAVGTPYVDEINDRELEFLRDYDFNPVSIEALRRGRSYDIADTTADEIRALGRAADRPEAQAVFISCTNLRTAPVIDDLEQELGKPVVTSNQASMWLALRRIGVTEPLGSGGRLMELAPAPVA